MHIHTSVGRQFQDLLREDLTESRHHNDVSLETRQIGCRLLIPDPPGLIYRHVVFDGPLLDRGVLNLFSPSLRSVRLGHCQKNLVAGLRHRCKHTDREVRGSHKNDSHASSSSSAVTS